MKPVYLGGVRGYQSAVYRPGMGWSGTETLRHHGGRRLAVARGSRGVHVSPLAIARRRRPGLKTKMAIIACMVTLAGLLTLVLSGAAQF